GGRWHPEPEALRSIRDAIAEGPAAWKKATAAALKGGAGELMGESLKRPPPGYDPQHALIEDLKRKDFCISTSFTDAQVVSKKFPDEVGKVAARMAPFMVFLAKAVGEAF